MKIIGAIGKNGSGKDEVLKYLNAGYGVHFIGTGDMVRGIADKEGIEPTRDNLGQISARYFREFGQGCFVKMAAEQIQKNKWSIAGISGIRSFDDVTILKNMLGKDFILVHVSVADARQRYSRMLKRAETRDPKSYEQFLQLDENEEKIFHIQKAAAHADYSIANDGSLDGLHNVIDKLVEECKLPVS